MKSLAELFEEEEAMLQEKRVSEYEAEKKAWDALSYDEQQAYFDRIEAEWDSLYQKWNSEDDQEDGEDDDEGEEQH